MKIMINFNFYNPTNLIFGSGSLNKLGDQKMPRKKAMIEDKTAMRAKDILRA